MFNLVKIYHFSQLPSDNLRTNGLSSLIHLNSIFNLALIIDKCLHHKYQGKFISNNVKIFCQNKFTISQQELQNIAKEVDLLILEATFLDELSDRAMEDGHTTALQAAQISTRHPVIPEACA